MKMRKRENVKRIAKIVVMTALVTIGVFDGVLLLKILSTVMFGIVDVMAVLLVGQMVADKVMRKELTGDELEVYVALCIDGPEMLVESGMDKTFLLHAHKKVEDVRARHSWMRYFV